MAVRRGTVTGADGTKVDFSVEGSDGPGPALVLTNGLTTTSTFWKHLVPRWRASHTIVMWDLPGHGTSDAARTPVSASIEGQPDFLRRVMDAAGVERAVQIGFSVGCQVVLETMRQLPERCEGVVLLLGSAGHVLSTTKLPLPAPLLLRLMRDTPDRAFVPLFQAFARLTSLPGVHRAGRALGLLGKQASDHDIEELTDHLSVVDPGTIRRMAASAEAHSAFECLSNIQVPLFIMSGQHDVFAPLEEVGRAMHRAAPHSEFFVLKGGTHTALLDFPELIGEVLDSFLERRFPRAL